MQFDIIDMTEEELTALSTVQMRLLRSAQREKDELTVKLAEDKQTFYNILISNGTSDSSLYEDKCAELDEAYQREV